MARYFSPQEDKMNSDQKALRLLKAMGKQGNLVSNYDGTGGQTALDVWSEGLHRHFKLFEIRIRKVKLRWQHAF